MARDAYDRRTGIKTTLDGARLRELRQSQQLGIAELASKTGMSTGSISAIEREAQMPSADTIAALTRVFGSALAESGAILVAS